MFLIIFCNIELLLDCWNVDHYYFSVQRCLFFNAVNSFMKFVFLGVTPVAKLLVEHHLFTHHFSRIIEAISMLKHVVLDILYYKMIVLEINKYKIYNYYVFF